MGKASDWLREERRKTLGDWVSFCLTCGFAQRYFDESEGELPAECPQCAGEMRSKCPECDARFSSVFAVECEACGAELRPAEAFGTSELVPEVSSRFVCGALAMTLALLALGACSYPPRTEYEPETFTSDPNIERLLAQLEQAINEKNPFAVCARYAAAAPKCDDIWRERLRTWTVSVRLSLDKITPGCAGDTRVSFLEKTRLGQRIRTLTVITLTEGADDYAIIDFAVGNRLSSLVIPRYGDCANFDDGSAGAPNLDEAGSGGQGNNR